MKDKLMSKRVLFNSLKDGQVFFHGNRLWIKAQEDGNHNAVCYTNSNLCCDFSLSCTVYVENDS